MDNLARNRRALILFPQSKFGKLIFYFVFVVQVLMYVFRAFTDTNKVLIADPNMLAFGGMLIDILSGVLGNLVIFWLFRWIFVKTNLLKIKEGQKTQFMRFASVLSGIALIACLAIPIYVSGGLPLKKSKNQSAAVDILSSDEKNRFREILTAVIQSEDALTPEVHAEFWSYLKKMNVAKQSDVDKMKELMTGVITKYQKYTWESAGQSLKSGRVNKSDELVNYENHLKSLGVLSEKRLIENDIFLDKVAKRQPILAQGQEFVVDEDRIHIILSNLDEASARVARLFTP